MKHDNGMTCTGVSQAGFKPRCASNIDAHKAKGQWKVNHKGKVSMFSADEYSLELIREFFPKARVQRVR